MDTTNRNIILGIIAVLLLVGIYLVLRAGPLRPAAPEAMKTPQGTAAAPGASPVSGAGQVVTKEGKPVKLNVVAGTPDAPQQSNPIGAGSVSAGTIKMTVSAKGFSPNQFVVRAGDVVTIALTSGDTQTHVFKFDDASLSAVAIGVGPGETRAITFNAPSPGKYGFHCDVPNHSSRGETGTMTVQ